jgi:dihydroorotate dehydrogenase (fumarate)
MAGTRRVAATAHPDRAAARPGPGLARGTTGVAGSEDVVKSLLAEADVVMSASALLRHGSAYALELIHGLEGWMARKGYGLTPVG